MNTLISCCCYTVPLAAVACFHQLHEKAENVELKREILLLLCLAVNSSLKVVFFLLGDSPAPKYYVPSFQTTLSVPSSCVV